MSLLIKNATVLYTGSCKQQDVFIVDGKIREVREHISSKPGTERMDATGCIILPGFISTAGVDWQSYVKNGVTTVVREVDGGSIQNGNNHCGPLDFVYRVSITDCKRSELERLGQIGVKLISLAQLPKDFTDWTRITRLGFVLDLSAIGSLVTKQWQAPVVAPYPHYKKPNGARMAVRVDQASAASWIRGWQGNNRYYPTAYWVDTPESLSPPLQTVEELKQFLFILAHFRSKIPAKLLGVFPKKGSIRVGADADLLFFSEKNFTPNSTFVPDQVMVKGQFIDSNRLHQHIGNYLKGNQTYAFAY